MYCAERYFRTMEIDDVNEILEIRKENYKNLLKCV